MNADPTQPKFAAIHSAVASAPTPADAFRVVHSALADIVPVELCTVLRLLPNGERERVYTSNAAAYPIGGRKKLVASTWSDQVLARGEPFLGRTPADIAAMFPDHELIASLGLGAVMNLVVRHQERIVGTVNVLAGAERYAPDDLVRAAPIAALLGRHLA